jgi:ribonucleotide reductase alpha subunit
MATKRNDPFPMPISREIWEKKYRYQKPGGLDAAGNELPLIVFDETVEMTWRRIAKALAEAEKPEDRARYEAEFYTALEDFKYLPAGRITAGAGTGRNVTLSNCFTMGTIGDDMDSIFSHLKEAALTMQAGGGIGYDFSTIRPKGAPVKGVDADASGPLSFMDVWDSMCRTIMSAGSRRGAMMATMRCDHPDIMDFITAKRDPARLRMFNVSVLVTDPFMAAVKADSNWDLVFNGKVYKTIKARELWDLIMKSTFNYAEPGVIFIDRVNADHNIGYLEQVATTNPCFTADTLVWTKDGAKPFSALLGTEVQVRTRKDDGSLAWSTMRDIRRTQENAALVALSIGGATIRCTPEHVFYKAEGGEVMAKDIEVGMLLAGVDTTGEAVNTRQVERVTFLGERADVFCGTVDGTHKFYVVAADGTGVLAHNCGEKPMGPYASCLLGSVNLARFVPNAFTSKAKVDEAGIRKVVRTAIRMMDNVVDVGRFPLPAQAEKARTDRQLGLGVTGLADMLLMMGLTYGSDEAVALTDKVMYLINEEAYKASIDLAKEKGAFPNFDAEKFLASGFMQKMPEDIRGGVKAHGIRNALLTSIAPTGTISLYAGNVSSGIEPVFAYAYMRKVLQKDGTRTEQEVADYAVHLYRELHGKDAELPAHFVTAQTLSPLAHVRMQAAAQKWVDSSISKTVNCPEDISFEDFQEVYLQAYETGCKGCTTYRPNDVTGSVLSVVEEKPKADAKAEAPKDDANDRMAEEPARPVVELMVRPEVLEGRTYKLKWPASKDAYYVTINDAVEDDGFRRPFEIFIQTKSVEAQAWISALTRMISAVFRRGGDVAFVAQELREATDAQGGAWLGGRYVPSLVSAIGDVIDRHMKATGFLQLDNQDLTTLSQGHGAEIEAQPAVKADRPAGKKCPACGEYALMRSEGCDKCTSCGHSKCG